MSKKTNEHPIVVNGVVLTPKVINQIKALQEDHNELANHVSRIMADAVSAIVQSNSQTDCVIDNPELLILELTHIRDIFKELRKP